MNMYGIQHVKETLGPFDWSELSKRRSVEGQSKLMSDDSPFVVCQHGWCLRLRGNFIKLHGIQMAFNQIF